MEAKISIIVPVYKVEKYINRCLDSILNQSYKNLEIILVDDGSPDRCGEVCKEYAKKDSRIRVIHKENGGLSDARNFGMKYITGEYTLFLDSDDYIEKNCIETLLKVAQENKSDIIQSGFYYDYDTYLLYDDRYYTEDSPIVNLDNNSLMRELVINERVKNFVWGKLYKSELIRDKYFKKGVLFEDVFWAHNIMKDVKKYTIIHKPLWYYTQREDSIVGKYSSKNLDILKGLKERKEFLKINYPNLLGEINKLIFTTSMLHYNIILKLRDSNLEIAKKEIKEDILKNYSEIYRSLDNYFLKWQLIIFKYIPKLNRMPILLKRVFEKIKGEKLLKRIDKKC